MRIQCTKELLKMMKKEPVDLPAGEQEDLLYTWNAVILRLGRTRLMVMQNSLTRCVIIFCRPMAKDFAALTDRMREAIWELFTAMKIPEDQIRTYLEKAGECVLTKSGSRKELGRVLQICKYMKYSSTLFAGLHPDLLIQTEAGLGWSDASIWYDEKKNITDGIECTRKMLAEYCSE